jgi:hypothetical protein
MVAMRNIHATGFMSIIMIMMIKLIAIDDDVDYNNDGC